MSKRRERLLENNGRDKYFSGSVDRWDLNDLSLLESAKLILSGGETPPNDNVCVEDYKQAVLQKISQSLDPFAIGRIIQAGSKEEINGIVKFYAGEWVDHQHKNTPLGAADRMALLKTIGPW